MKDLERIVLWGPLFLSLHRWAAYGVLLTIGVGAYQAVRRGRLGTMGVTLAIVVLAELVTGFFLPWDKLALWEVLSGHPSLTGSGSILPAPMEIIMWYGLHLVVLPLAGLGLALAARRKTRSVPAPPADR